MSRGTSSEPWYWLTCAEPQRQLPAFDGQLRADVCIIGGGLAGLATALSLVERERAVVLLEAKEIGEGASGRNGGMVSAGFARSTLSLERRLGRAHARELHRMSVAAMERMRSRISRDEIACGLVEGVIIASFFATPAALQADAMALNKHFGMRLEIKPRAWMRETYRTSCYTEGLYDPDGFHLDPLALTRGYARAACGRGAQLFARTPVLALERGGHGWKVRTAAGLIEAEHVVLATNVYGKTPWPQLRRALLPVESFIIVTEPLGSQLGELIAAPHAVYDDRFATGYYRPLADGRLLWGGRVMLDERVRDVPALMRRDLAKVYPALADVQIEAAWPGRMGFARHKMPLLGALAPGLWMNTGHGGHGLNTTSMGGDLLAAAISEGDRRIEHFAPFGPVPVFGRLGRLAAQGIYWSHIVRDEVRIRLARRSQRR